MEEGSFDMGRALNGIHSRTQTRRSTSHLARRSLALDSASTRMDCIDPCLMDLLQVSLIRKR
eukprot:5083059-Heterocapsa_arctica.AAC.1